jgi:membrane protease YdiL (CAAX protease family)
MSKLTCPPVGSRGGRFRPLAALVLFCIGEWFMPQVIEPISTPLMKGWKALGLPFGPYVPGMVGPAGLIAGTCAATLFALFLTVLAALVSGRSWTDFRLRPIRLAKAGEGFLIGFVMVAALILALVYLGVMKVAPSGQSLTSTAGYLAVWLVGMGFVGAAEEISCRGAALSLLSELANPWVACLVTSIGFAVEHLGNTGETLSGVAMTAGFGLVAALGVMRTGSIWWAIGMHAGWDWGLENFFGAIGSGLRFQGSFLVSTGSQPAWLTGGSAGPEGSALVWIVMGAAALYLAFVRRPGRAAGGRAGAGDRAAEAGV